LKSSVGEGRIFLLNCVLKKVWRMNNFLKYLGLRWDGFREVIRLTGRTLKINLLRTSLSLLGVSIGIFSVVSILVGVDSLQNYLIHSLRKFGNNTLYIDRFDYKNMGNQPWAKIRRMRKPSYDEYRFLQRKLDSSLYDELNFRMVVPGMAVKYRKEKVRASLYGDAGNIFRIMSFDLDKGRFYNALEREKGLPVAVVGWDVADALFGGENPLGKYIQIGGKKIKVIGVFRKEGGMVTINPANNTVYVPYLTLRKLVPGGQRRFYTTIMVKPASEDVLDALKARIEVLLRNYRKLKPGEKSNFYINNIDFLKDMVKQSMRALTLAGWILGGFSLLVGAFGIANIMFVSVKERTREIGIQKALGAKRGFILSEFLLEAVILALVGGLLGLVFVLLIVKVFNAQASDFVLVYRQSQILKGLLISALTGVVAGFFPAWQASRLHPIDAIRK